MTSVFLDTFFLLALVNSEDDFHQQSLSLHNAYRIGLVTTEYVLIETLDALVSGDARQAGLDIVAAIREDRSIKVVAASTELLETGIRLFASRPDKNWGITDCMSFVVMRELGITKVLTADHHFEQAGFRALLRAAM